MIVYVDASVLLRIVLGEPGRLGEWSEIVHAVTSSLARVESLRTLDRLTQQGHLSSEALSERRGVVLELLDGMEIVGLSDPIFERASDPFPTPLGTLDALHLATALAWREGASTRPAFATHDHSLGLGARACGFEVLGVSL